MPPRINPTSADLYRESEGVVDFSGDEYSDSEAGRLPLQMAVPIVIALNLSLWLGIGLAVRALL